MENEKTLKGCIKNGFQEIKKGIQSAKRELSNGEISVASIYLIEAMSQIESYQFVYLDYYIKFVDVVSTEIKAGKLAVATEDRVKFDYEVSTMAEMCYGIAMEIMEKIAKIENVDDNLLQKFIILQKFNKRMLYISARWHIQRYIEVMEYTKTYRSKKLPKRLPLLKEAFFFADRMLATKMGIKFVDGIMPKKMVFATQPNSGKSYLSNVFSILGILLHKIYFKSSGVIRMTNTGSNAMGFSGQCKNMISSVETSDIFPELKKYFKSNGKNILFKKEPLEEWLLADLDSSVRASMFARGRDSGINGLRNDVALVIDDLSDGFDQMNNDQAHKDMVSKYDIDMDSRKEDENVPELIVGTMFNEFDLSNTLIERARDKYGELSHIFDKKGKVIFPNSLISPNKEFVVVAVDCFDERGESVAPKLISTEKLLDKQKELKPYEFELVYRQIRTSREPRMYDYDGLFTYSNKNSGRLDDYSICVLDPTRKRASDYFVLTAYRKNFANNRYRVYDTICVQKSLGKVNDPNNTFADEVVDFLIENKAIELFIENNTSNLIATLVEDKLHKKGYSFCKLVEKFNTRQKDVRIFDMESTVKNNLEFPIKNLYPLRHPMTVFMDLLTRFDANNVGKKGNYDDVVDNVSMFAENYIYNKRGKAKIKAQNLPSWL